MKPMTTTEILTRARSAFKMGEFTLVEKLAMRILEALPESPIAFNLLGSVCEKTGRFRKAIELFQKAVELKPDYTEAHNNLGVIFKRIQSYGEAIPHFEKAINLSPRRGDVYYNLGNVYKALNNNALAEENFQKAIAVDPTFVASYINLGTVLEAAGRYGDAIRIYQKGLQADTNQPRLHYNLGVVYERIGKTREAREEYEAAVRAKPGWTDALNNLGVTLHGMGDERAAEKTLREVLRTEPRDARALNNLGVVIAAQGRREEAAQAYRDSMKADPHYAQPVENLSSLLEREGRLTEAMEELQRLLSMEPDNLDARLRLAGILRGLENFPQAIMHYAAVLNAQPAHREALKGLALAYERTGEKGKALECFEKLEALGGEDQDFRLDRAFLWKEAGETALALEEVQRYLSARPDDPRARILLADIYATQGHLRQAAQTLSEVREAFPEDKDASSRLAKLYRELGEPRKAIETMEGLINKLEQGTDPKDMEALSRAMDEYEQAISEHEKDFRDEREKTIRKLRELAVESAPPERAKPEEDLIMIEDLEPLEEEAVPIINVGGMEPVFAVRETDEELQLEEIDESIPEESISIEDERPPNLVNLLKDQELYEENPALQLFEPLPQLPSQRPRGQQQDAVPMAAPAALPAAPAQPLQSQPPEAAPPPPAPLPPQQSQLTLSPRTESLIANSLKESAAVQAKIVDRLFDEMKSLSRKVDERNQGPPQALPIIVSMPRPESMQPGPSPPKPIAIDPRGAGPQTAGRQGERPQADGLPRYAAADLDEEPDRHPRRRRTDLPRGEMPAEQGASGTDGPDLEPFAVSEPEPEIEWDPEPVSLEPEMPTRLPSPHPSPHPAAEQAQRPAAEALGPMAVPARKPRSPALQAPAAQDSTRAKEPDKEPTLPAETPPNGEPDKTARTGEDVRQELRDYLNGVRDKLDKGAAEPSKPGDLLDYPGKLSDYLPERDKEQFRGSNERLAMESLKAQLAGKKGLRQKIAENFRPVASRRKEPMTRSLIVDTFSYLKDLSAWHPDKAVAAAMRERIESIVAQMGSLN